MSNREVAMEFVRCFCAGELNRLASLVTEDLQFKGPFHQCRSRDAYLDTLKNDPPEQCGYRILSVTESGDRVSIFYDYERRAGAITIAQSFTLRDQKIREILLVFDGRGFA